MTQYIITVQPAMIFYKADCQPANGAFVVNPSQATPAEHLGRDGKLKRFKMSFQKVSAYINLMPAIGLGFFLVAFFVLNTAALANPQVMVINFPINAVNLNEWPLVEESKLFILILGAENKVYYYSGVRDPKLDSTDYSEEGLRKVISNKKVEVAKLFPDEIRWDTLMNGEVRKRTFSVMKVLVKPMIESNFGNLLDTYNEVVINSRITAILSDITDEEVAFIRNPASGLGVVSEEKAKVKKGLLQPGYRDLFYAFSATNLPDENKLTILLDSSGKASLDIRGTHTRKRLAEKINEVRLLGLTTEDILSFVGAGTFGVPIVELKSFLRTDGHSRREFVQKGIPKGSTKNDLGLWIESARMAQGEMQKQGLATKGYYAIVIKANRKTPYSALQEVFTTLTDFDFYYFKIVNNS